MLEDIKKKLTKAGQAAVSQTKKVAESANLNVKIKQREGDLNKALLELGKKFYLSKKDKIPKEFEAQFAAVNEVRDDIRQMKEKLNDIKTKDIVDTPPEVAEPSSAKPDPETPTKVVPRKEAKPAEKAKPIPNAKPAAKAAPEKPAAKAKDKIEPAVIIPAYTTTKRNCTKCNKPLKDDEVVCPECGAENPVK